MEKIVVICGMCDFEENLCLSAFSSSSFFFFASWQLQSLLKFLYHGQYLGFFEKFRKENFFEKFSQRRRKRGKRGRSHYYCSTEERRIREI